MIDLRPNNEPIFNDLILNDIVFLIDTREQNPWDFRIFNSDKIQIKQKRASLKTGDYTLEGYEDQIVIERKSLEDFVGCVSTSRTRFEAELERMQAFRSCAVVIEAPWKELKIGNWRAKTRPSSVTGSCISWQLMRVPFAFEDGRREATIWAARFLTMFHKHRIRELKKLKEASKNEQRSRSQEHRQITEKA